MYGSDVLAYNFEAELANTKTAEPRSGLSSEQVYWRRYFPEAPSEAALPQASPLAWRRGDRRGCRLLRFEGGSPGGEAARAEGETEQANDGGASRPGSRAQPAGARTYCDRRFSESERSAREVPVAAGRLTRIFFGSTMRVRGSEIGPDGRDFI